MIVTPKVVTPPTSEPVTKEEVIEHLRLNDGDDSDAFLDGKITTARMMCEKYSNLSFLTQEIEIKLDGFPCAKAIALPRGPVQSVDDFTYIDSDGNSQPLTQDVDFTVDLSSEPARVSYVSSWPSSKDQIASVTITYTAGYANDDHDPLPGIIKEAVLKTVARLYEKRGDSDDGPVLNSEITDLLDEVKVYYNANV